jgi:TonB family protein
MSRLLSRPSVTLFWALAASVTLHAGIVAVTLGGDPRAGAASLAPRALVATLTPAEIVPPEPAVIASPAPSILAAPVAAAPAPPVPQSAPAAAEPAPAAPRGRASGLAKLDIVAAPLADRNRLGDVWARQLAEFPVEVDRPARLDDKVVARYPPAALRAGREGSVAVWFVVDANGHADDIQVVDGDEEFAAEVLDAVRSARFHPAEDKLRPIRYPLALEFDFRLGGGVATTR